MRLYYAEVETPVLDATVLLAEALGVTKERLLASLPDEVDAQDLAQFKRFIRLRCEGNPVSYIRRRKEFYGIEFYVDERVLVPRPETELIVEEVVGLVSGDPDLDSLHDACTGSGCVAIAVKLQCPDLKVSASDISSPAQDVFKMNCIRTLTRELPFYVSDLFCNVPGRYSLITVNPPYLKNAEVDDLVRIGWPEPAIALRGGKDGTDVVRRAILEAGDKLEPGGYLLVETAPDQAVGLTTLMRELGYRGVRICDDLTGRPRVIRARSPS